MYVSGAHEILQGFIVGEQSLGYTIWAIINILASFSFFLGL